MSFGIVNTINLEYSIIKEFSTNYNKSVEFYTGYLFPDNKNLQYALWNFGDGTTQTVYFSALSAEHANAVIEVGQKYNGFFPKWKEYLTDIVGLVIPKFYTSHTYTNNGQYEVNLTVVDSYGTGFVSKPSIITVNEQTLKYTVPVNWSNISEEYTLTEDASLLFSSTNTNLPVPPTQGVVNPPEVKNETNYIQLSTFTDVISALPINARFSLLNSTGRIDIDYIEWNFGDGTVHVNPVLGSPVIDSFTNIDYSYPLISNSLSYSPYITLYMRKGTQKLKTIIPGRDIILQDRTNISVSDSLGEITSTDSYAFNIQPTITNIIPVETTFTAKIYPNLKYIFWDFNDGTFEVVPVSYVPGLSNINQTINVKHTYTSLNYSRYVPKCIFLYRNPDRTFYSESYKSRYYLDYLSAIVNPQTNYFITPIFSTTSYSKYNNIHILTEYGDYSSGTATLKLRLSLDVPDQIYYFEKLIWSINGVEIVQDKNTSRNFGYLDINNFPVPSFADIRVQIFGIPAIFSDEPNNYNLVYYDEFYYPKQILSRIDQENINEINQATLQEEPVSISPFTVLSDTIITPVIEIETQEVVEGTFPTISGIAYSFDRLFQADKPVANFLNRDYPSTVSIPTNSYATKREIGFFTPSKTTNILVEPGRYKFLVNFDRIAYDKPYYFPDPYKYGSDTDAITFNVDNNSFKKKDSFSIARNEPNTSEQFATFYGYSSDLSKKKYNDLSYVYDEGYIHNIKRDVFGNSYGLIKDSTVFDQNIDASPVIERDTLTFNGYKFFDSYFGAGFNFNYFLTGGDGLETVIPGLSTYTNSFIYPSTPLTLRFGTFEADNYTKLTFPVDITTTYLNPLQVGYRDGSVFMISNSEFVADPISSDRPDSVYPGGLSYYYNELYEAGVHTANPYVRPLTGAPSPANFTQNVRLSGNNGVIDADCGLFVSNLPSQDNLFITGVGLLSAVNPVSTTQYSTTNVERKNLIERNNLAGSIFIKDSSDNVSRLTDALPYISTKYGSSIYKEISSTVREFDLVYNTYFIQTSGNLVIDRIVYEDDIFKAPRTPNIIIPYNKSPYNPISNRFKIKDNVYFATLTSISFEQQLAVVPIIHKFNLTDFKLTQIYSNIQQVSSDFIVNADGIEYVEAATPVITYNDDINRFNLAYLLKDQNKSPYLISVDFTEREKVAINSIVGFRFSTGVNTITFNSNSNYSIFSPVLTSGNPTLSSYCIVL